MIMSESVHNLINAIASGNALETEAAFNAAMAEKISARLDDMRIDVAQGLFKGEQEAQNVDVETTQEQE
jgi:hypothetical protein